MVQEMQIPANRQSIAVRVEVVGQDAVKRRYGQHAVGADGIAVIHRHRDCVRPNQVKSCSILSRCIEAEDTDLFLLAQAVGRAGDAEVGVLRSAEIVSGDVPSYGRDLTPSKV